MGQAKEGLHPVSTLVNKETLVVLDLDQPSPMGQNTTLQMDMGQPADSAEPDSGGPKSGIDLDAIM